MDCDTSEVLTASFAAELLRAHGELLPPAVLPTVLGFSSIDAYRRALSRKKLPVRVFKIEHRRGHYAFTRDVAAWLARQYEVVGAIGLSTPGQPLNVAADARPCAEPSAVLPS